MTRTQKLGLCTWLPDDPVCLAEVNDNFSRLDENGGRSLALAEASMINLGGLMAAQARAGGHAAYAQNMQIDAFQDGSQLAGYDGVYLGGKQVDLLSAGLESGVVSSSTGASGSAYNASNIQRQVTTLQGWAKLFDFRPPAYGTITRLVLKTASTSTTSVPAHVKLSLWDADTDTILAQTGTGTITRASGEDNSVGFSIELQVDPNRHYAAKVWIEDMPSSTLVFLTLTFTVTPTVKSSGYVTMQQIAVPAGSVRAELLLHTSPAASAAPALAFGTGSFTAMTAGSTAADVLNDGTACTLRRYTLDIPDGTQTAQLRLTLSGSGGSIYDYALIFL